MSFIIPTGMPVGAMEVEFMGKVSIYPTLAIDVNYHLTINGNREDIHYQIKVGYSEFKVEVTVDILFDKES
jgi:hypothetical protein